MKNNKLGAFIIILCSLLWAVSGICGQLLFQATNLTTLWLSSVRLLISGAVLLVISCFSDTGHYFDLFHNKKDLLSFLIFMTFGCLCVQYSYFSAIEASNAATGTILQYVSPLFVVCAMAVINKKFPRISEILCCLLAVFGVFLVSTGGNIGSLAISPKAVGWGIFSAACLAYYNIAPVSLVKKYGAAKIVGLGMLLSGIILTIAARPFNMTVENPNAAAVTEIAAIILLGTVIPFVAYPKGVAIIGPAKSSILATTEPMSAFLISLLVLGETYPPLSIVGFFCIVIAVIFVTLSGKKEQS